MELALQGKRLVLVENGVFKEYISLHFWKNQFSILNKQPTIKGFIWIVVIGKSEDLKSEMEVFSQPDVPALGEVGEKVRLNFRLKTELSDTKPASELA